MRERGSERALRPERLPVKTGKGGRENQEEAGGCETSLNVEVRDEAATNDVDNMDSESGHGDGVSA